VETSRQRESMSDTAAQYVERRTLEAV